MEIAASTVALVEFTSKLIISLAKFTHEAKSVDAATSELFHQVSSLESILKNVHKVLKKREAQRSNIPIDDPEIEIWDWAKDILHRCERTVKNLEVELRSLDNGKSDGWAGRAWKQLKLNINTPAIARIEKQIAANVSSAQLMMACFQTFTQEETQTTLNRGVENLANAIEIIRGDIAKLSHQKSTLPITVDQGNPFQDTASDNFVEIAADSDDDDLEDVELMKDDAKFASSLADRLSVSGESVTGTKTPLTYRSVIKGTEGDDKIDIREGVTLIGLGYDSRIKRKPVKAATREHRNTSRVDPSDVVELDTTLPPEILSALIDRCRDEAQAAYKAGDYPLAEKHLLEAILHNENRHRDGTFPFEDWSELRQFLAEIMSKNLKFDEAANEYRALIVEAKDNRIRKASLCFALAAMYRVQSNHSGNKEVLAKMEEYAKHALNSALQLSQQEGSLQWPSGHPSLQETAQLLVEMFEGTGRLNEARTYRALFLMTSKTVTPVSPSPHSAPENSSQDISSPATMPSSHLPAGQLQPAVIDSTPTTSDSNHNNPQLPTPQTSSVSSVSRFSVGFDQRPIDRSSFSQSVSTAVSNDLVKYIRRGDCGVLELILDTYNNIEARDENNLTPLLLSCKEKKKDIVRFLLERNDGPNLSAKDDEGCTCLHLAIIGTDGGIGNDIVNLLIKHGADVNIPTAEDFEKMTPLHYAVRHNKLQSARALLDAGADKEALDSIGRTPLALALKLRRREDICCLLIRRGASYNHNAALRDFDELDFALADWDRRHNANGSQWAGVGPGGGAVSKPAKRGSTTSADSVASEVSMVSKFTNKFSLSKSRRRSSGNKARKDSSLS